MATTTINKQKLIQQVLSTLNKGSRWSDTPERPVLEQFIYAVCRESATRAAADQAFTRLRERFFDWNEVRVSSAREIADVLDEFLPNGEARAQRIIDFLQEVFETTFSFDLESLHKKPIKQAAKQLSRYQAANDYAVSWVVHKTLNGHMVPVDPAGLRVLRRLNVLEEAEEDFEAIQASLEQQVPKSRAAEFVDLLSDLAQKHCLAEDPTCPACPLGKICPSGAEAKLSVPATKKPR